MKISIFRNDPTTKKDEIIITIFTALFFIIGVVLMIVRPSVWIISSNEFVIFGLMLVMASLMIIPCIIYRFKTNYDINKKGNE